MNWLVTLNKSISTKIPSWSPMEYTWGFESWLWCRRPIVNVISPSLFQGRISACVHDDAYWVYWITQTSQWTFLLCVVSFGRCYVWYFCLCKPRMEECEEDQTWKIFTVELFTRMQKRLAVSGVLKGRRRTTSRFLRRFTDRVSQRGVVQVLAYSSSSFTVFLFLPDSRILLSLRCLRKHNYCELCLMKSYLKLVALKICALSVKHCLWKPQGRRASVVDSMVDARK